MAITNAQKQFVGDSLLTYMSNNPTDRLTVVVVRKMHARAKQIGQVAAFRTLMAEIFQTVGERRMVQKLYLSGEYDEDGLGLSYDDDMDHN